MGEIEYRFATMDTAQQQVDLFNKVFQIGANRDSWARKHLSNPLHKHCMVMAAFDGEKIVGINGFVAMDYTYNGEVFHAVQSCDTAVDPDYRGKGIFTRMIITAMESFREEGFDLLVGYPNKNSFPGFLKMGGQEMQRAMKYFFSNNVKKAGREMLGKNFPRCLDPLASMWRILHSFPYASVKGYELSATDTISVSDYNRFLKQNKIHIELTQAYLDWKLSAGHQLVTATHMGRAVCSVVVCEFCIGKDYRRGNILAIKKEKNADTKEFRIGLAKIMKKFSREYDVLSIWHSEDEEINSSLRKLGWIQNFSEKQGSPLIISVLTEDQHKRNILLTPQNWCPEFIEADYVLDHNV